MPPASNSHLKITNFTNILFYGITPLLYMKSKKTKTIGSVIMGTVILDLAIWDFTGDPDIIRHNANELSKAILFSYQLSNFGPQSFGIPDDESGDE